MARLRAAAGSVLFLLVAPGLVCLVGPWVITGWARGSLPPASGPASVVADVTGVLLAVLGAGILLHAFARFVVEGLGTPAPVAPTEHLVVGGLFRHVRNPMHVAVVAVVVGQALVLRSVPLLLYALAVATLQAAFVRWYEEPHLRHRFGDEYVRYRAAVPGWWPRPTPYRPVDDA